MPALHARALVRACHPGPVVAVTVFATLLAACAGNGVATCGLAAAAVLFGQLTIGWTNDRVDADSDREVGRVVKPVAMGEVSLVSIDAAIAVALLATVAFSLALGWRAGLLHLGAVGCGWLYNLWLKRTWLSWLPYAVAFGALPGIATLALPHPVAPGWWVVAAAGLLGVAANLTNALPDLEADRMVGAHGVATRLGARASLRLAMLLLVAAALCILFGPAGRPTWTGWVGATLTIGIVLGVSPFLRRRVNTSLPFYALIALVPIDVLMIVGGGRRLR
jgi:4-hydroxybenzoate polyprenyltransferase